jgi:hypothetical protein
MRNLLQELIALGLTEIQAQAVLTWTESLPVQKVHPYLGVKVIQGEIKVWKEIERPHKP